jgi:hypothetical protein
MGAALAVVLLAAVWDLQSSGRGLSRPVGSIRTDWQQFRGPNGSGAGEGRNLPVHFGPAKNILWKMSLPAGVSSPVLADDRLIVTASEGRSRFVIASIVTRDQNSGEGSLKPSTQGTAIH